MSDKRLNLPDLAMWGKMFQRELVDDIDNGARIDCTRKPGFYTVQTRQYVSDPDGEWMLFDADGDAITLREYIVTQTTDRVRAGRLMYAASNNEHGLMFDCTEPHGEYGCECEPIEFEQLDDVYELQDRYPEHFNALYGLVVIDDPEEFARYAEHTGEHMADRVDTRWVDDLGGVFLTRKSGERYANRHHPGEETKVYAHYVWHNPDLYNAIALLAALDFNKSKLVFDNARLDQLDY